MRLDGAMIAGKKLKSWKEAAEILKAAEAEEKQGKCVSHSCNGSSISSSSASAQHATHHSMPCSHAMTTETSHLAVHHDCMLRSRAACPWQAKTQHFL
jgi:hypothetical protein